MQVSINAGIYKDVLEIWDIRSVSVSRILKTLARNYSHLEYDAVT